MIIHGVSDWPGLLAAAFIDEGEEAQGQRRSAWSTTDEETEPGFFAPQSANVTLPIWPVFCRVATKGTLTPGLDEVVQPKRLAVTIRAASELLRFIANLLC